MFERSKLEAIADGKKDFPDSEEDFAHWLEAVEDDQLYTRILIQALVVNNQKAVTTLAEGGVVVTPEITQEAEQIRRKRIAETAERERRRITREQAEKEKHEQKSAPKPPVSQPCTEVPPMRSPLGSFPPIDQAPPLISNRPRPQRTPECRSKRLYECAVIAIISTLLVVNVLSLITQWLPKAQQEAQSKAQLGLQPNVPQKVWEYRVVRVCGNVADGIPDSRKDFHSCLQDENVMAQTLNQYRDWELVSTTTEIETVHPNYGNDDYVTGLQSNTRSCSVLLIFRKVK